MAKKKTPHEKKQAEYERDHYTFPVFSARGFRKTWKKKKNSLNRAVRRKSKNLLHAIEGRSIRELTPEQESLTATHLQKGLSRKKTRKFGVVNLREKIARKKETRENRIGWNIKNRVQETEGYRRFLKELISKKDYSLENYTKIRHLLQHDKFLKFLDEEPGWVPGLEQWLLSNLKRLAWEKKKKS